MGNRCATNRSLVFTDSSSSDYYIPQNSVSTVLIWNVESSPSFMIGVIQFLNSKGLKTITEFKPSTLRRKSVDLILYTGGDETILDIAHYFAKTNQLCPILGFFDQLHPDDLGLLTPGDTNSYEAIFEALFSGNEARIPLHRFDLSHYGGGELSSPNVMLNEVIFSASTPYKKITIDVYADDELVYQTHDDLIISTSNGSAGTLLRAGGPIIHPQLNCVSIKTKGGPQNRTLILPASNLLIHVTNTKNHSAVMCLDGRVFRNLVPGDIILLRPKRPIYYIARTQHTFFESIRKAFLSSEENFPIP